MTRSGFGSAGFNIEMIRALVLFMCLVFGPIRCLALEPGDKAPGFQLPRLDADGNPGDTPVLLHQTDGKVRYIDFWASWCGPCRVSFPEIIALHEDLAGDGFEVIAISVDRDADDARRFMARFAIDYPVLLDITGETAARYEVQGMPTSFVLNAQGQVTLIHQGYRRGDMTAIRAHIESLLYPESTETGVSE